MNKLLRILSFIFFISLLILVCTLHSKAGEEASTQTKDIQIFEGEKIINVSKEDIKKRILEGEPVHFLKDQPEEKRTIVSTLIIEAIKKRVKNIDIKNAIITGDLDFHIKENLVGIEESGMEVDEIKKQKDRGVEKVFLISSFISIEDCQLQGNLEASYDLNLKSFVMFKEFVAFNTSTVKEANFRRASFKTRVNFTETRFNGETDFRDARFNRYAEFGYASFKEKADFRVARFKEGVGFINVIFNGYADFDGTSLSGEKRFTRVTSKNGVSFRNVNLSAAVLDGASLSRVNLSGADLTGINWSRTVLINANFSHSIFQPANIGKNIILGAKGLSSITFDRFDKIVDLRNEARKAGFRNQEKQLTAALRKYRFKVMTLHERILENVFFDYPTDYGAKPWRSLEIFGAFFLVFSIPYMFVLKKRGQDGIWKVWSIERARRDLGGEKPELLTPRSYNVILYGLYFSLLSAFHIGWRDLNVGSWIARIQPREYSLKATGWIRVVSGAQSLISIYLLALWALTQFGRPFE